MRALTKYRSSRNLTLVEWMMCSRGRADAASTDSVRGWVHRRTPRIGNMLILRALRADRWQEARISACVAASLRPHSRSAFSHSRVSRGASPVAAVTTDRNAGPESLRHRG